MMRMRTKTTEMSQINGGSNGARDAGEESTPSEWEMRPGGMLVQKRTESDQNSAPPPTIRVRVKHGSIYHEIRISSQATFGELKKMLVGPTGLHHLDQKVMFKDKERDSKAFLDSCGVKDRSKMVVLEDPISQEKRFLEMRRSAKMEKASKSIADISFEVDRLAGRVSAFESVINRGGKVVESDMIGLTELLMNQLLKLDGITADGDVKLQRKMQVKRVQKYVETLDMLKVKNSASPTSNGQQQYEKQTQSPQLKHQQQQEQHYSNGHGNNSRPAIVTRTMQEQEGRNSFSNSPRDSFGSSPRHSFGNSPSTQNRPPPSRNSSSGNVVITTNWETFDAAPAPPSAPASAPVSSSNHNNANKTVQPRFTWDLL